MTDAKCSEGSEESVEFEVCAASTRRVSLASAVLVCSWDVAKTRCRRSERIGSGGKMVEGGQVGPERAVQRDGGDGVFLAISQGSGRAIYESGAGCWPEGPPQL